MTIKEFARIHGVSSQAVYGKLSSKGISVSSVVQPVTKDITDEGMSILKQFYQDDDSLTVKIHSLQSTIRELEKQVDSLQKQLAVAQATQSQVDLLKMQLEMMIESKNQAQKNAADWKQLVMRMTTPKLPGESDQPRRKRWFSK